MAADYARVQRAIWSDDDFRELPVLAQWLYFHLMTSPSLNYAGVTDWRPARIAALTNDMTADDVERAALHLEVAEYVIIDRDTEEALVRSFIHHDGLMKQPNVAAAMVKAHSAIVSKPLRGVVVHELKRLHKDEPNLNGWSRGDVALLLRRVALEPLEARGLLLPNPLLNPSGKGSGNPSVKGCLTPSPAPTPSPTPQVSSSHHGSPGSESAEIGKSLRLKAANE